ncbi:MAG TPA: VOC family protein [Verrucomicrobiales bacterium]|jgi:hypothetical protein|nr:VOC family protein [Verrucomicrobiales bacterium]
MSRPVHFEIHAENPERAIAFYSALFGWTFSKWDGPMLYWMVTTGPDSEPGINGGLLPRKGETPGGMQGMNAWICTVNVDNVDAVCAKSVELGGVICLPKMAVAGVGWLAYSKDTEGNVFGMMQADPEAK